MNEEKNFRKTKESLCTKRTEGEREPTTQTTKKQEIDFLDPLFLPEPVGAAIGA